MTNRANESRERERQLNEAARFLPQIDDDTRPCIEVGGAVVFAYVKDGALVVSVDFDTVDPAAFSMYGPDCDCVPVRVSMSGETVFEAGA